MLEAGKSRENYGWGPKAHGRMTGEDTEVTEADTLAVKREE